MTNIKALGLGLLATFSLVACGGNGSSGGSSSGNSLAGLDLKGKTYYMLMSNQTKEQYYRVINFTTSKDVSEGTFGTIYGGDCEYKTFVNGQLQKTHKYNYDPAQTTGFCSWAFGNSNGTKVFDINFDSDGQAIKGYANGSYSNFKVTDLFIDVYGGYKPNTTLKFNKL